jgi:hypothetical protein
MHPPPGTPKEGTESLVVAQLLDKRVRLHVDSM